MGSTSESVRTRIERENDVMKLLTSLQEIWEGIDGEFRGSQRVENSEAKKFYAWHSSGNRFKCNAIDMRSRRRYVEECKAEKSAGSLIYDRTSWETQLDMMRLPVQIQLPCRSASRSRATDDIKSAVGHAEYVKACRAYFLTVSPSTPMKSDRKNLT